MSNFLSKIKNGMDARNHSDLHPEEHEITFEALYFFVRDFLILLKREKGLSDDEMLKVLFLNNDPFELNPCTEERILEIIQLMTSDDEKDK